MALIGEQLKKVGCTDIQALGDADVEIAKTVVDSTILHSTTLDLLMFLLHYYISDRKPLYFRSDNQSRSNMKADDIDRMKHLLGNKLCTQLLFLHAFT